MASTSTTIMLPISQADLEGLSPEAIQQLSILLTRRNTSATIAFYPIAAIVYISILYFNAKLLEYFFRRLSPTYRKMTHPNKRSSIMYILNILHTTIVLILQLIASPSLAKEYTVLRTDLIRIAATIVSLLYLFEIIYRESMRTQLLIHHFATLFAICLVAATLDASHHPSLIVTALVWLFQASTEQFTFVALLMYRLKYPVKHVAWLLKFSAIQNLIPKFGFAIYLLIWWGLHQVQNNKTSLDIAYSIIFFICLFTLIPTQIYGSWILWKVANNMMKKKGGGRATEEEEEEGQKQHGRVMPDVDNTEKDSTKLRKNADEEGRREEERPSSSYTYKAGNSDGEEVSEMPQLDRDRRPWDISTHSSYTLQGRSSGSESGKEV